MNIRDLKVGEVVELLALEEGGIATSNSAGGTEYLPRGTRMVVTVTKRWDDYETGIHYWGQPDHGKRVFFGEFDVKATPVGGEPADTADMGKLEVGDKVEIEATKEWGISTDNAQGGTVPFPRGRKVVVTVTKKWDDHETGINYWGKPERGGKTLYFGEFWTKGRRVASMDRISMLADRVAVKLDTQKEVRQYRQEHDSRPGTKVETRNKHEMQERRKDKESSSRTAAVWMDIKEVLGTLKNEDGNDFKANWTGAWDRARSKNARVVTVNRGKGFEKAVAVDVGGGSMVYIGPYSLENVPSPEQLFLFNCEDALFIKGL